MLTKFRNMFKKARRFAAIVPQVCKLLICAFMVGVLLHILDSVHSPDISTTPLIIGDREYYYICPILTGGIGNAMFVYASAYGIAASTGRKLMFDYNHLEEVFEVLEGNNSKTSCNCLPQVHSKYHCAYDHDIFNLHPKTNFKVGDYLQSYKYFENHQRHIRKLFTFKSHFRNSANIFLTEVANNYTQNRKASTEAPVSVSSITFIGVHVRRGDMMNVKMYSNYGYVVPNSTYVTTAMDFMEGRFPNIVFIVASNDMKWAKSMFNGPNIFYTPFTDATHDLVLLSSCNHSITTVGTYGWWSAYLAGGITVYYKYPAREGSLLREHFSADYSDFFLPEWIGLS